MALRTVKELFKRIFTTDQRARLENTTQLIKLLLGLLRSLRVRVQAQAEILRLRIILQQVKAQLLLSIQVGIQLLHMLQAGLQLHLTTR